MKQFKDINELQNYIKNNIPLIENYTKKIEQIRNNNYILLSRKELNNILQIDDQSKNKGKLYRILQELLKREIIKKTELRGFYLIEPQKK